MSMRVFDAAEAPDEEWRPGVRTRMLVSHQTQSSQLTIFEQWCDPGYGAPLHIHVVEEVLEVIEGIAEFEVYGDRVRLVAGQGIIVPAGAIHGFTNAGNGMLHTRATLAEPIFEARYIDPPSDQRRWEPDPTDRR